MKLSRSAFIIVLIVVNIALDQISKVLVRIYVAYNEIIPLIDDYLIMTKVENKGAFLGMGSDLNPILRLILLLILPTVVLLFVLHYVFVNKNIDKMSLVGFACIIGGGLANLYDRIVYGEVTDFLHIDLGGVFRTGIFNIADMSVMLGMGLLLFGNYKHGKLEAEKASE
ncbi:signal peptidase II [Yeosuana sp. MJ-SS3]|jgi:signal peptidase II|uniref:Lipoprotein signal peptidase n=1 Tax=Gilvirhabdus luticola TaxID=3079858 RepID=A0ABU3U6C5_9FLAO|nr:signal peptidase II [Yeosuana sp. MJ-SS3]MDU8885869.1 signal peptidase II [Yeosuana sp. MJ-SS3]